MSKKNKKLFELFRESKEPNFMKFMDSLDEDERVIYAEHLFAEKKRLDKWWQEALERSNKVNNIETEEE